MAKKAVVQQTHRIKIISAEYTGDIDEMPQEVKDMLIERNPKAEQLLKNLVAPTPPEPISKK